MGEKWQVVVSRWTEDDGWIEEAQLIAPREALARFAPGVVAEALGVRPTLADSLSAVSPPAAMTEVPAGTVIEPADDKPKRTRRTKAQIAADEAAALIEAQTAAEVAVTNGGNDPYPQTEADRIVDQVSAPEPFNPFAPK